MSRARYVGGGLHVTASWCAVTSAIFEAPDPVSKLRSSREKFRVLGMPTAGIVICTAVGALLDVIHMLIRCAFCDCSPAACVGADRTHCRCRQVLRLPLHAGLDQPPAAHVPSLHVDGSRASLRHRVATVVCLSPRHVLLLLLTARTLVAFGCSSSCVSTRSRSCGCTCFGSACPTSISSWWVRAV